MLGLPNKKNIIIINYNISSHNEIRTKVCISFLD